MNWKTPVIEYLNACGYYFKEYSNYIEVYLYSSLSWESMSTMHDTCISLAWEFNHTNVDVILRWYTQSIVIREMP